jgi:uncharacterized protein YbjT (DUF2867 family)
MDRSAQLPLIAVLGCTGTVGSEVMRQLADERCAVRGVLRRLPGSYPVPQQEHPARVSYVLADYASEEQLQRAFSGADALFLLVGTNPDQVHIESLAINAAMRADVRRIIKISAPLVAAPAHVEVANWHRAIEEKLATSGLEYCNLRPYAFMQNWLRNTQPIQYTRTIFGSAGDAPRNYVDCRDVAAVATSLLLSAQPPSAPALTLTGPESISNGEMAARLSRVTGLPIRYTNLSREEHYQMLRSRARLPHWLATHIVELEELALRVPEVTTSTLAAYTGRYPRTMDEFLHEQRSAFMPITFADHWITIGKKLRGKMIPRPMLRIG